MEAMGVVSSGRVEIPNTGSVDFEFSNAGQIVGFQIHTTVAMQITGDGFSAETGQNSDAIVLRRGTAGVVGLESTEVDGMLYINTAPVPFYRHAGTHKVHVYNGSGGAGYITIFKITANSAR
jgi:hypothetical protein